MSGIRHPWPIAPHPLSPQARGLVAWYPFAPTGRTLRGVLQGRHLDITGGQWVGWQPRAGGGQALLFNGSTDCIRGTDENLPSGSAPFSLTAWFRGDVDQSGIIASYGTNVSQQQVYVAVYEVGFGIKDIITGNADINLRGGISGVDGVEHLVVSTWDGTTLSLYIDGTLVDSSAATGFNLTLSGVFAIGSDFYTPPSQFYAGRIADVRVYDRALSPALVRAMWQPATRWELHASERRSVSFVAGGQVFERSLAETMAGSQAFARLAHGVRSLSNSLGCGEAYARLAHGNRALADTVAAAQAYARLAHGLRNVTDTVASTNAFQRLAHGIRIYSDTLALADSEAATVARGRSLAESLAFGEAFTRLAHTLRSLADTSAIVDAFTRLAHGNRGIVDTTSFAEAFARLASGDRVYSDTFAAAEAYARLAHGLRSFTDTLGLDDVLSLQALAPGILAMAVVDVMAAAESYQRLAYGHRSLADTLAANDAFAGLLVALRAYADTLAAAGGFQRKNDALRAASDTLAASDIYTRLANALRAAADTLAVAESYQRLAHAQRSFSDTLAASDLAGLLLIAANLVYGVPVLEAGAIDLPGLEAGRIDLPGAEMGAIET